MKLIHLRHKLNSIITQVRTGYQKADGLCGGGLHILFNTSRSFNQAHAAYAAASIAYFAFFSLFPLLLILVVIGSSFLKIEEVYSEILALMMRGIPVSQELIETNLQRLLDNRSSVTVLSLVSLIWSASAVFNTLAYNINLAWPIGQRRNILQNRLIALAIIGLFAAPLGLSFIADTLLKLLPDLIIQEMGINIRQIFYNSLPIVVIFFILTGLYRWVPKNRSQWKAVLISAFLATVFWQLASMAFSWYLGSGLADYSVVYGSLAALVALMLLIFILNWIVLIGAHLCATIDMEICKTTPNNDTN